MSEYERDRYSNLWSLQMMPQDHFIDIGLNLHIREWAGDTTPPVQAVARNATSQSNNCWY